MSTKGTRFLLLAAGVLGFALVGAMPAMAQHGGGHGGGGGGHVSAGGHFGGGGQGGGGGHFGGGGHVVSGGHFGGGGHYQGGAHFAGSGHYAAGARGYGGSGYYGRGYAGHGYAGHGAYGHPYGYYGGGSYGGGYYGHGYSTGAYWRGGYWHGGYWPRAYYGVGFSWFLPILPLAYATYWYGGLPYYYANDVYYTWDPSYDGYVATDPPPLAESSGSAAAVAPDGTTSGNPAQEQGANQVFMYPKNGQSAEQQAIDKSECQKWASDQAGQTAQNGSDYYRAMVACVQGRGYSAQ